MAKYVIGCWMWWLEMYKIHNPNTEYDLKELFQRYIKGLPPK